MFEEKNSQKSDLRRRLDSAKSDSKTASKTFSKSYGEAYGKRIDAVSPFKNRRAANKARWQKAESDYAKKKEARSTYKKLKEERKSKLKETYKKTRSEHFQEGQIVVRQYCKI